MRIVIVGGGFAGLYTALKLQRRAPRLGLDVTIVNDENFMQYQPFLPEAASGSIEPRHVVVPLRQVLRRTRLVTGDAERVDMAARAVHVRTAGGQRVTIGFDHVVVAPGSVSRVLPIPGLAERAVGFKTVSEAIHLRNQLLSSLEIAAATTDPERRRAALTYVFVGGGYAGVEALAELEDMARDALAFYPGLDRSMMRWVLVEAAGTILPEIGEDLARYAIERLRLRGIDVQLNTRLESATGGEVRLSDGSAFRADTIVWTAGVAPHPLTRASGLPVDETGRVICDATLRVPGPEGVWAAGDAARVMDPDTGRPYPPTAQHAIRQGAVLAANICRVVQGKPPRAFRYRSRGLIVSLGRHKGVARTLGVQLRGFPAWWLHRTYHLSKMPTLNRKVRIALDWTVQLLFPRDVVQLGSLQRPREAFTEAVQAARRTE